MNRVVFEPKPLSEDVERIFDFTSLLAEGETIAAASVENKLWSGTDSAPENMLDGGVELDGPRVKQKFTGGTLGAVYSPLCAIGTCNGQVLSLAAYLAVVQGARE